ncbi:MAG: hypothetical protein ACLFTQ_00025 [Candidatus Aenigmatarchaeota archaeon]
MMSEKYFEEIDEIVNELSESQSGMTGEYHGRIADKITKELFKEIYKEEKKKRLFGFNRKNIAEKAFKKASDLSLKYLDEKIEKLSKF